MNILRKFVLGRDRRLACEVEQQRFAQYSDGNGLGAAEQREQIVLDGRGLPTAEEADRRFVVGTRADDPTQYVCLERTDITAAHSVMYGASGMGKTIARLMMMDQELRRRILREKRGMPPDCATILIDPKHDMVPSFRRILEARLAEAPEAVRERILSDIITINPNGRYVVPFPLLTPDRDVEPELHATSVSGLIGRLSGSPFGAKQRPALDVILLALILERKTIMDGVELLGNWEQFRGLGLRSSSPLVRSFFEEHVRMPASIMDGIRARLLRLVFSPKLRAMFSATEGFGFDDALPPGKIVMLDLDGDDDLIGFACGFTTLKLSRAIRRQPNGAPPVIVVIDEFQRVLQGDGDIAEQTASLLEMARSRGIAFHLLTQSPSSISSISTRLLRAVHTNASIEILGATDSVNELAHILPVTGRQLRPPAPPWEAPPASPWLSREEEMRSLVEQTQALPARHFWLRAKRREARATLVRTLDFNIPPSCNAEIADRIERGSLGQLVPVTGTRGQSPKFRVLDASVGLSGATRRPRGF